MIPDGVGDAEAEAKVKLPPFTMSVDAPWGMGKSSLLRRLDAALNKVNGTTTIWFNAWTAQRADAVEGLIKSVLCSFDGNVIRRAIRGYQRRASSRGGQCGGPGFPVRR